MEHINKIAELVIRAKATDQEAWEELYKITVKGAYFTARKVLGNNEEAIDIVQDAYIVAFQRLEQLEDPSKFAPWFSAIVANKCRDYLKRKKPLLFSDIQEEAPGIDWEDLALEGKPEQVLDHKETVRLVAQMIEDLPEDQKLCIILFYRDELSVAEIAQALEVSEGTVKSRLNYARRKIKTSVEELEKKGTKLYGVAPLPILGLLLRRETVATEVPSNLIEGGAAACSAAVSSSVSGAAVATTTKVVTKTAILSSVGAKIAAGAAALVVLGGGVAYTVQQIPTAEEKTIRAYEEFLAEEISPEGLEMNFYAHVELDGDSIPELLVSNYEGTDDDWSEGELYRYDGESIVFCGKTDARYESFYVVNGNEVLGKNRMGNQYIGTQGTLITVSYHWNEEGTRNDPAIQKDSGEWEYVTQEKFDYYNPILSQVNEGESNSYIKSFEKISLTPNPYIDNILETALDYSSAWTIRGTVDGDVGTYTTTYIFFEYGECYCFSGKEFGEIYRAYRGRYLEENGKITFSLDSNDGVAVEYTYQVLKKAMGVDFVQVSETGLWESHVLGQRFALREDENTSAERYISISNTIWWSTPEAEIGTDYYQINIPDDWEKDYVVDYDLDDRTVRVYEKGSYYGELGKGLLFSVTLYHKDIDMSYLPQYRVVSECLVNGEQYRVVVIVPTDIQFLPEHMTQYQKLAKDIPEICENIMVSPTA